MSDPITLHQPDADALLHVYSPQAWHDTAYLIGTRLALVRLADAIHVALETGSATPILFTADGEGFLLRLACVTPEELRGYVLPYTDAIAEPLHALDCPEWPKKPREAP